VGLQPPAEPTSHGPGDAGDYLARLEAGLRLCGPQRNAVRSEIADHLQDRSADLLKAGLEEPDAGATAMAGLGPPETLAESISRAQLTRRRLLAGIPPAAYLGTFAAALGTAAGVGCILATPLATRLLTSLALLVNIHLYVPETGEWRAQLLLAGLWVGAFMAGRVSLPRLANETRRLEASIARGWSLGGGLLLLLLVLLDPVQLDPTTVIGLLGVPVAFVAGTWRYQKVGDDPTSRKGAVAAAAILLIFVLMPGVRTWAYDPAARGGPIPAPATASAGSVSWDHANGYWLASVQGVDPAVWHDVQVELWPAARQGPFIVPDPSASVPLLTSGPDRVLPSSVPNPPADFWVAVTAVGGDGQRRTIHAEVHQSDRATRVTGLLSWLLGDR
jgi:hypothetical protein